MRIGRTISLLAIMSTFTLTGCMEDKIDKQIEEQAPASQQTATEIANETELDQQIENNRFDEDKGNFEDNYVMSERQKEMLGEAESQTAEEALKYNKLDEKVVLTNEVPKKKERYTDGTEAAQYFSYLLFQYHSSQINGSQFYKEIESYMHSDFEELLPSKEENREAMFNSLQELFNEQIRDSITKYEISEVGYNEMIEEGFFYRKYTLTNGKEVYYKTTIGLGANNEWLLINDEPSEAFNALNSNAQFEQKFIENKGE